MLASQQKEHAPTGIDWELQRKAYIQNAETLNEEFEKFKKRGGTFQPPAEVTYTLPAPKIGDSQSVVRLPQGYRRLQIFTGCAWVSYNTEDYVLNSGQEMSFDGNSSDAVVSSMGKSPLRFQISR